MTSVVDVVRTYMDAASGLTRLTRQRAVVAAKTLLKVEDRFAGETLARDGSEEATRGSVGAGIQSLASELVATSAANREALSELVHSEMDRVLHEAGYVPREDHDRLLRRVVDLERRLAAFNSSPAVRAGTAALPPREDAAVVQPDAPDPGRSAQAAPSDHSDQGIPAPRDPAHGSGAGAPDTSEAAKPASAAHAAASTAAARSGASTTQPAPTTPADAEPDSPTEPRVSEPKAPESDTAETAPADSDESADSVVETPEGSVTGSESSSEPAGASTRAARTGGKSTTKTTGRSRSTKSTTKKSSTGKSGKSK